MCAKEEGLLNFSTSKAFLVCILYSVWSMQSNHSLNVEPETINKVSANSKLVLSMELTTPKSSFFKFSRILATLRVICFRLIMVENNWLLYDEGMYFSCNFAFITAHWVMGGSPR